MTGRWLMLIVGLWASLAVVLAVSGSWMWGGLLLLVLSWLVARFPDSQAPLGWLVWAVACWVLGGDHGLWGAAVVALALGAVHLGAALTARTAPTGPAWIRSDWYRLASFLGATAGGMGIVVVVMMLPALEGLIWVPAAVFLFGAVVVVLRLGIDGQSGKSAG